MEEFLSNPRNVILLELGVVILTLLILVLTDKIGAKRFVKFTCILGVLLAIGMSIATVTSLDTLVNYLWLPVSLLVTFFISFTLIDAYEENQDWLFLKTKSYPGCSTAWAFFMRISKFIDFVNIVYIIYKIIKIYYEK